MKIAWKQRRAVGFGQDDSGVSAVEFALILPFMLTLFAGMSEMAHAIDNWRKVTQLSRTVADLTALGDSSSDPMASGTMSDILSASSAVLRPFATTNVKIVVSALGVYSASSLTRPRVCSSTATGPGATARTTGISSDLTIPVGFNTDGNRYVLAEVSMPYAMMMGATLAKFVPGLAGTIALKSSFAWPVRNGVVHNSPSGTPEVTMPSGSFCP